MAENPRDVSSTSTDPLLAQLVRALDVVGDLIASVRSDQWSAPTPCTDWNVRQLAEHLIAMNRVFTSLLVDQPTRRTPTGGAVDDPMTAYRDSANALLDAFAQPRALQRDYVGPLGSASGAERLQIRLYDLLAHGWDLAQATGQSARLPDDIAEQSLRFAQTQLADQSRAGRFGPARDVSRDAPAVERLVAFLGRPIPTST